MSQSDNHLQPFSDSKPFSSSLCFLAMDDNADGEVSNYSDGNNVSLLEVAIVTMASKVAEQLSGQAGPSVA